MFDVSAMLAQMFNAYKNLRIREHICKFVSGCYTGSKNECVHTLNAYAFSANPFLIGRRTDPK
jgi:hypothetical protein